MNHPDFTDEELDEVFLLAEIIHNDYPGYTLALMLAAIEVKSKNAQILEGLRDTHSDRNLIRSLKAFFNRKVN